MRIFHLADTHLGYMNYKRVDPETGINQREQDVYIAFRKMIDVALEEIPDLVVHAGDLFNTVRPTNRAITFAFNQLSRLAEAGIPLVIIAGNHETPRLRGTGSIFRIFEYLPNIYPVYGDELETVDLQIAGKKVEIQCLPHIDSEDLYSQELSKMKPGSADYSIGLLHGTMSGLEFDYTMGQFSEMAIGGNILDRGFDYIGLGHFHKHTFITENCAYSGSLERFSFAEAGQEKGFIEIEMDNEVFSAKFRKLAVRSMTDLGFLDVERLDIGQAMERIKQLIDTTNIQDSLVRLRVYNVGREVYDNLDFNLLDKLVSDSLYLQFDWSFTDDSIYSADYSAHYGGLIKEFGQFLKGSIIEGLDKQRLKDLALDYFQKEGVEE